MNIKGNQKYQSTHEAITKALMDSLKEKNIKQVSVSEICCKVNINRSTFYEHFLDVYDVLEQIVDSVSAEALSKAPDGLPTKENLMYLLCHIRDNKEFYTLFFNQNLPLGICERFFLNKTPPSPPEAVLGIKGIQTEIQLAYHQVFFKAGIDAILKKWLERDCAETIDEVYEILQQEYRELPSAF